MNFLTQARQPYMAANLGILKALSLPNSTGGTAPRFTSSDVRLGTLTLENNLPSQLCTLSRSNGHLILHLILGEQDFKLASGKSI